MRKILSAILVLLPSIAFGVGHVDNVKIESVYCGYAGTHDMCSVKFYDSETILDKDTCHTLNAKRMQFKGNTAMGQTLLTIAMTAFSANKPVDVYSTGSCTIYAGLPDVNWITIKN